ncbi:MAG: glycosyltransferase family 1 protein [Planctomycetota bacterium]
MKMLLVTDSWAPLVNGVVRTLSRVVDGLRDRGHDVLVVSQAGFTTVPCPTEPEIRLALFARRKLERTFDAFAPDALHIATEGPLGFAARSLAKRRAMPFTTSYHTKFPEYLAERTGIPRQLTAIAQRWFHRASQRVLVPTESLRHELIAEGWTNTIAWTRGVDVELFRPRMSVLDLPRPLHLSVGRVAVEKNLTAFLELDLPGSQVIVGDGPQHASLVARFPHAHFLGRLEGEALARVFASADVFVFPSRTDTFGLVLLEALASGLPVAAFPVTGPLDLIDDGCTGALDEDLALAIARARQCSRSAARQQALRFSWERCVDLFEAALAVRTAPRATPSARV